MKEKIKSIEFYGGFTAGWSLFGIRASKENGDKS